MREISESIENRSIETIQTGVQFEDGAWVCLTCGERFEPGEVYPFGTRFFDAEKAAKIHAEQAHGSALDRLLDGDSKYVSLTDNQKHLMRLLAEGHSDAEIAKMTGTASATVRRQRFAFREKAKQAKMYLAMYNLMMEGKKSDTPAETLLPVHEGARMVDDRYVITEEENERFLKNAFSSLDPPRLRALPVREKRKVAVLRLVARQFQPGVNYTERQVNDLLRQIFPGDFVTLRRYLIEYGYLDREVDGSRYWLNT
ncbi:DUF2087 domain-containing protein [Ruminococcaceae bacterium OttesenSCG-928-D13]|nr:DUF2087 domain-containing protein [Ruminococcaceae bacterium OttesenSCG-928-D13]